MILQPLALTLADHYQKVINTILEDIFQRYRLKKQHYTAVYIELN